MGCELVWTGHYEARSVICCPSVVLIDLTIRTFALNRWIEGECIRTLSSEMENLLQPVYRGFDPFHSRFDLET